MKLETTKLHLKRGTEYDILNIAIPHNKSDEVAKLIDSDKVKVIEIKNKRKSRSLDSNAALWKLLDMMAKKLRTTKDELYLDMLDRYGVFTHIIVKKEAVYRVKQEWKTIRELGEVSINGKTGIQLQCFYGSSGYNQEEFSRLLEGVVDEGKSIGIELISKQDMNTMLQEWGV